jgi:DNA-binding LacI/PurR family transcriptional regulator
LVNLRARAADVEADITFSFGAVGVAAHDGDPVFLHQQGLQRIHPFGGVDAKAAQINPGEIGPFGHPIVDGGEGGVEPRRHMGEVAEVTAVLCHYPEVALGGIYGVEASGRTVGKDNYIGQQVALLGFDDVAEAELTTPALTFVSSPAREIGRQAARRLLTRMQQPELAPNRHIITPNLQKRESA